MKISIPCSFFTFLLIASATFSMAAANETEADKGDCDASFTNMQVEGSYAINFQAAVELGGTTYTWDFGNGNTSNEVNPQDVFFGSPGIYTVCLNLSSGFCNETSCQTVTILCAEAQTLEIAIVGEYASSSQPENLTLSLTGVDQYFEYELYYGPMSSSTVTVYSCNASDCLQLIISDPDNDLLGSSYQVTVSILVDQNVIYDQIISNPVLDENGIFLSVNLPEDCTLENVNALTKQTVTTYPNPFHENLRINGIQSPCTASLFDMCGSLVLSSSLNSSSSSISTSELSSGLYVLKVNTSTGVTSIKVMKE